MKKQLMRELPIAGCYELVHSPHLDTRGQFVKIYDGIHQPIFSRNEWAVKQVNLSSNNLKGTIRGIHLQVNPFQEGKIVTCISGGLADFLVDLRPMSSTFGEWTKIELDSRNRSVVIAPGVGHAFQTLQQNTIIQYIHSGEYSPNFSKGVRYDDLDLGIEWPLEVSSISQEDANLPSFKEFVRQNEL